MPLFSRSPKPKPTSPTSQLNGQAGERRVLFLDDDPSRAEIFLAENPQAVWVQTVAECLAKLEEPWDEVHLDHDLGGEHFVDLSREDCGMEVVRWLCLQFRPHLKTTQFYVHSHNPGAATMMGMQIMVSGYAVEVRPFGSSLAPPTFMDLVAAEPTPALPPLPRLSALASFRRLIRVLLRRETPEDFGYSLSAQPEPPLDRLDLGWTPPPRGENPEHVDRPDFSWAQPAQATRRPEPIPPPPADDPNSLPQTP